MLLERFWGVCDGLTNSVRAHRRLLYTEPFFILEMGEKPDTSGVGGKPCLKTVHALPSNLVYMLRIGLNILETAIIFRNTQSNRRASERKLLKKENDSKLRMSTVKLTQKYTLNEQTPSCGILNGANCRQSAHQFQM